MRAPTFWSLVLVSAGLVLAPARRGAAADVELPAPIPTAKLAQQVGLTEISVDYDCPAVGGRKIFGGLVPYDRPWAVGGPAGARIKFTKEVRVGTEVVPAGSYWLVALPGNKGGWTLSLNKDASPGGAVRAYRPELDVARIRVAPKPVPRRERLIFTFSDISDDHASLDLEWEALRVSLPIQVNTSQQILASISGLEGTWRAFANAARYMLETTHEYDAGLKYIDQALALKDDWYCMWVKGALFAAKGDYQQAREWAIKARNASEQAGNGEALAPELRNHIAEWTRRGGSRTAAEAQLLRKEGDAPTLTSNVASAAVAPPPAPEPVAPVVQAPPTRQPATVVAETPAAPPPSHRSSAEREAQHAPPSGDPPLLRRARLRRR